MQRRGQGMLTCSWDCSCKEVTPLRRWHLSKDLKQPGIFGDKSRCPGSQLRVSALWVAPAWTHGPHSGAWVPSLTSLANVSFVGDLLHRRMAAPSPAFLLATGLSNDWPIIPLLIYWCVYVSSLLLSRDPVWFLFSTFVLLRASNAAQKVLLQWTICYYAFFVYKTFPYPLCFGHWFCQENHNLLYVRALHSWSPHFLWGVPDMHPPGTRDCSCS